MTGPSLGTPVLPEECEPDWVSAINSDCDCDSQSCSIILSIDAASGPDCHACTFSVNAKVVCTSTAAECRDFVQDSTVGLACEHFFDTVTGVQVLCHDASQAIVTTLKCKKCL